MTTSSINWDIIKRTLALLVAIYLFSPLVSMRCFGFSQEMKACDIACLLVPCLAFVSCGLMRTKLVRISAIDLWLLCYAVFLFVRALLVWDELDKGIVVEYVACLGVYVLLRNMDWRTVRFPVVLLSCASMAVVVWHSGSDGLFFPGEECGENMRQFSQHQSVELFCGLCGSGVVCLYVFHPSFSMEKSGGFLSCVRPCLVIFGGFSGGVVGICGRMWICVMEKWAR